MLDPNETELFSMAFDKPMKELEMRIMQDIVRRIRKNGEDTKAADWQINRLQELGASRQEIKNYIKDGLDADTQELSRLYKDIIRKSYERDSALYKYRGKRQLPFEENAELQGLISAASDQTSGDLENITQSLGFAARQPDGRLRFRSLDDYYQNTLDNAMLDIASGRSDYNTVLKRAVREMTSSGLRTGDYSTGRSSRVDAAARRSVMTGLSQITAKLNEDNMDALDTEYVEVSWHSGARPSHQVWQGKVFQWDRGVRGKKAEKALTNDGESGIINTGAISGALNPHSDAAEKHAIQYYESVRHMKTDTARISKATGISQDKIDKIKKHVFIAEHDLIEGHKRFDPSYDMAQSWQRLINGSFEEKDIVLLKHEYAELRYMEKGLSQDEAHIKASRKYNYAKYCE